MKPLLLCTLLLPAALLPRAFALPGEGIDLTSHPPSVQRIVDRHYRQTERRLEPRFRFAGVAWPPQRLAYVALKEQRRLELWAEQSGQWVYIHDYPIQALSGQPGPKLREGDLQVPEGFYRITWLNPHSNFHLSLKLDYPNQHDREQARREGRRGLGGEIFIHGEASSRGCLAMGNRVIEDLFVLTALVGKENVSVLIAARDFRAEPLSTASHYGQPEWVSALNQQLATTLQEQFPREPQ